MVERANTRLGYSAGIDYPIIVISGSLNVKMSTALDTKNQWDEAQGIQCGCCGRETLRVVQVCPECSRMPDHKKIDQEIMEETGLEPHQILRIQRIRESWQWADQLDGKAVAFKYKGSRLGIAYGGPVRIEEIAGLAERDDFNSPGGYASVRIWLLAYNPDLIRELPGGHETKYDMGIRIYRRRSEPYNMSGWFFAISWSDRLRVRLLYTEKGS